MTPVLSYVSFLFSATNQHGVHSPFIYDYVTKCLYKKNRLTLPIPLKILVKSIDYFNYRTLRLLKEDTLTKDIIQQNCPLITFTESNTEVLFGSITDLHANSFELDTLGNNSMLLVADIYKNASTRESWLRIKEHEHVRVTVDLFYCGVVFFRKEQVKEHFKIRI